MAAPDTAIEIKAGLSAVLAIVAALLGKISGLVILWVVVVVLDYLTGTAKAMYRGKWSSSKARSGLWHKLGSLFSVLVAALCDIALGIIVASEGSFGLGIDYPYLLTPIALLWYTFTELGSIIENAAEMGAPIPEFLRKAIESLRKATDKGNDTANKNE